jgi:hypothetical protein
MRLKPREPQPDDKLTATTGPSSHHLVTASLTLALSFLQRIPLLAIFLFAGITLVLILPLRPPTRLTTVLTRPSNMSSVPFRTPPQAPPTFTGTPESIVRDTKRLIATSRAVMDELARDVPPADARFATSVLRLAQDENVAATESHVLGFYQAVAADKALRDASTEADRLLNAFQIESGMREDMFAIVEAVYAQKEPLDAESRRLLEKMRKEFVRNGLGLGDGAERARFKEIKQRLAELGIVFQKNLNEETGGIWFTPEEVDGVPADVTGGWTKGEGENKGKIRFTYKYPDLFPLMKYANNPVRPDPARFDRMADKTRRRRESACSSATRTNATRTCRSSKRRSCCATKPRASSATPTTPPSGSKTRWPRRRSRSTNSSAICAHVSRRAAPRKWRV